MVTEKREIEEQEEETGVEMARQKRVQGKNRKERRGETGKGRGICCRSKNGFISLYFGEIKPDFPSHFRFRP